MNSDISQPKSLSTFWWIIIFLVVALLLGAAAMSFRKSEKRIATTEPSLGAVPDFSFTTQDGKTLTKADLAGKIWVADFIFTRCGTTCPIMTSRMAELAGKVSKTPNVRLISVTVDPAYDTPAVLTKYAANIQANPAQWTFLTGPIDQIAIFSREGMKQALMIEPGSIPEHSTRFLLVDQHGMIHGYYDGGDPEVIQKLLVDIGNLLRESKSSQ